MAERPPTLTTLAKRAAQESGLFRADARVLCACSGGPDSTAMLHALSLLRSRFGHRLVAVGVDHGLRAEAAAELGVAGSVADRQGVPFEIRRVSVEPGGDLQARARRARHRALQAAAEGHGAVAIALGHTADDRAETLVMRLLRGAGPRGLAVMPLRSEGIEADPAVPLVRPLIRARRDDVLAHLSRHEVPFAEDPSNADPRFLRSRVRAELMPLLEALSPQVVAHLCALADAIEPDPDDPLAGLPRAQRQALERALRSGQSGTTVRLSGGRDVALRFVSSRSDEP